MSIHERLRQARIEAGYESAADAARAFGWNKNTVASNENGNRGYGRKAAEKYARAYHVSIEWLLTGKGGKGDTNTAEVVDIWSRIPDQAARKAWIDMGKALADKKEG